MPAGVRSRRRPWLVGAAALVAVVAIAAGMIQRDTVSELLRGRSEAPQKRQWTLVAEFEGPADDPGLASAAREMVMSVLDQSAILRTVPRDQVREALRMAGKPDSTRVGAELGRELAFRSAIRTVVSGKIDRVGAGYPITLRVHDVEGDSLLVTVNGVAASEKELIPALDRLARRLRGQLGERGEAIATTRLTTAAQAATPSFEAYRKFTRATELMREGDGTASIAFCRAALELDPDFARAHQLMAINLGNLGQHDSATVALRRALARPERLNAYHRGVSEAVLARYEGDLPRALAIYDRLIAEDSSLAGAWNNRSLILEDLGRFDAALESFRQATNRSPVAPSQGSLANLAWACMAAGRFTEAETLLPRLRGAKAQEITLGLMGTRRQWARAESLARALTRDPATRGDIRAFALRVLYCEAIARGELTDVDRQRRELYEAWKERDPLAPDWSPYLRALLHWTMGVAPPTPPPDIAKDEAWLAAARGDTTRAHELLRRLVARPPVVVRRFGATPALVRALIAARAGRWSEVVGHLDPVARQPVEPGFVPDGVGRVWPRFLIAEAYERLGKPDSAAVYFELLLPARTPPLTVDMEMRRALSSYANYHLVLLYARMGRGDEAESHWKSLSETLTNPDPRLKHWLDEARAAVAAARSMGRGPRT